MAVVVTVFNTVPGQVWASGTTSAGLVSTDPAFKVNTQLTNWIAAINNPAWIKKRASTTDPIRYGNRNGTDYVAWDLIMNEGETQQYGFQFMERPRIAGAPYWSYQRRYDWTSGTDVEIEGGTANNIYSYEWELGVAGTHFIAYEGAGSTPWFVYAYKQSASSTSSYVAMLSRLSVSGLVAGSYYPSSGLGKWVWGLIHSNAATYGVFTTPQLRYVNPHYGLQQSIGFSMSVPALLGYFFNLPGQYGYTHYLGQITNDILVSNVSTGSWGDTVTINGINYTALRNSNLIWWVKTSN